MCFAFSVENGLPARARVRIDGRVQGVFFRAETQSRALSLGLVGWVRNEPDGSVRAEFEGPRRKVETIVEWCSRGPRGAVVRQADVDWVEPERESSFEIR